MTGPSLLLYIIRMGAQSSIYVLRIWEFRVSLFILPQSNESVVLHLGDGRN